MGKKPRPGGDRTIKALGEISEDTLAASYQPFSFLQSETLDTIKPVLDMGNGGADRSVFHEKKVHATKTPRKKRTASARG